MKTKNDLPPELWNDPTFGSRLQTDDQRERDAFTRKRYGGSDEPDPQFGRLASDTPGSLRNRINEMVNGAPDAEVESALREGGVNLPGPGRVTIHTGNGSEVVVELRRNGARWEAHAPVKIHGGSEWRAFSATTRDALLELLVQTLRAEPAIRDLPESDRLATARLCVSGHVSDALVHYIRARCGDVDATILYNPAYANLLDEAAWFIFIHSTPEFVDSSRARSFMRRHVGDRPVSVPLLQSAFAEWKLSGPADDLRHIASKRPTEEELQALTDEEIQEAFSGIVKNQASAERRLKERLYGVTK